MSVLPLNRPRPPTGAAGSPPGAGLRALARRKSGRVFLGLGAVVLAAAVAADLDLTSAWQVDQGAYAAAVVLAITGLVAAALRAPADRRSWALLAAGMTLLLAADLWWVDLVEIQGSDGVLSGADAVFIAGYTALIAGLALLRAPRQRARGTDSLDALVVTVTVAAILLLGGLRPDGVLSGQTLEIAVNLFYPLAGLTIVWLLVADAYRFGVPLSSWRALLAVGFGLFAALEAVWTFTWADPTVPWCASALLIGAAGLVARDSGETDVRASRSPRWLSEAVPLVALGAFGGIAAGCLITGNADAWTALGGLAAVTAVIIARLVATIRRNRQLLAEAVAREAELDEARRQAESADRAKSSFLATMTHELRTPLSAIIAAAELLEDPELPPGDRGRLNRTIATASDALLSVINDVLDYSKIEAGRFTLERVPFDPREVVGAAAEVLAGAAGAKDLALAVEIAPDVPDLVLGDPARLRQILLNLGGNAVKFTGHGRVRIGATAERRGSDCLLELSVADTGPGIAPEIQRRLFAPFEQADAGTARHHGGTGLGLAISHRLTELMGGTLTLESAPGAGAVFRCRVPVTIAAARPGTVDELIAPPAPAPEPRRILVVDDDPVNRDLAVAMLARLGRSADTAAGGPEALERLAAGCYDVAFIDLRMPGMDGFEVVRRLRATAEGARVRCIALSADVSPGVDERCRRAGFDEQMAKPVRRDQLEAALTGRPATAGVVVP